jgi:RNA polymerase sigma-70 factor, ECF subfamily
MDWQFESLWAPPQIPPCKNGHIEMGCTSAQAGSPLARSDLPENVREWFSTVPGRNNIPPVYVREWLGEIVRLNYRVFFGIAYGFFRDRNRAEDIVQDAVLKGLRNLARLKQPESVVGWLARITLNACLEAIRNEKNRAICSLDEAVQIVVSRSVNTDRFEQQRLLLAAISTLPENQAIVVHLRFLQDCDIDSIAERLDVKRNTVEVRLHRALNHLANLDSLKVLKGTLL